MSLIEPGRKAPAFTLTDQSGKTHTLSDYAGRRSILYFYPKDDTPGCTQETCDFRDRAADVRQAQGGGARRQHPRREEQGEVCRPSTALNFPLLADADHAVAEKYGVWQEKSRYGRKYMGIARTTYLIDADGKVARRWDNVKVAGTHVAETFEHDAGRVALPVSLASADATMSELRVHVHDMDCADEAALVRRALAPNPAVHAIEFDLIHGFVDITFDDARDVGGRLAARRLEHRPRVRTRCTARTATAPWPAEHAGTRPASAARLDHRDGAERRAVRRRVAHRRARRRPLARHVRARREGAHDRARGRRLRAVGGRRPVADVARAAAAIRHLRLDMHALVCLTVIGAAAIGEWSEGAAVAFLFALAHRMEAWSIERARAEIAALVGRGPALVAEGRQQPASSPRRAGSALARSGRRSGRTLDRAIRRRLHAGGHRRARWWSPSCRRSWTASGRSGSIARWCFSCSRARARW